MRNENPNSEHDIDGLVDDILRTSASAKKAADSDTSVDEDMRIYEPPKKEDEASPPEPPAPVPVKKRAVVVVPPQKAGDDGAQGADDATRRVELPDEYVAAVPTEEEPEEDDAGEQLSWEDVTDASPEPEEPLFDEEEAAIQERLRLVREEKIRSFRMERGMKLSGEEEESDSAEEPVAEEEPEYIEDFTRYEDAAAVRSELAYRLNKGRISLAVTAVFEFLLVLAAILAKSGVFSSPYMYLVDAAVCLLIMMLVNHALFRDGWEDLKESIISSETAICLVSLLTLVHTALQFISPDNVALRVLPALAGFGLLLGCWNRQLHLNRIVKNFDFVADEKSKWTARKVEDPKDADEIGRIAVAIGQPHVTYFREVPFLHHYLGCAYERPEESALLRWYLPSVGIAAFLCALIYTLAYGSFGDGFALFVMLCAIGAPMSLGVASGAQLLRAAKKTAQKGGMLIGKIASMHFGETQALAVDAADLFPDHCMLLGGIKTFSGTRIDEAILDAAAVSITAGGPLSHVFRRIIEDRIDLLEEVDTLVYEQEMGLSGWVGGRRVLVGNRRLLENHGVDVPSRDYEMKYCQGGRQPVYLSTAGELSAMFIVTYAADEEIASTIRALNKEDVTILVRTCDPNVTQQLICETLGLDDYYVEILGTAARRRYEQLVAEEIPDCDAELACDGTIIGKATAILYATRLRVSERLALCGALISGVFGVVLCALLCFVIGRLLPVMFPFVYMVAATALVLALPLFKKI